ncbi:MULTISPECIES: type II toxin-antitoxin system YafQ family toxin [Lactobacillaceae]|uniref:type II toxin-antitoxin system YafQ family toxin n=1 Tax=Lactobacillaceae TaxID=33958 RepID=UPI001CC1FA0B|nr:type II toxin-antitoxin system YafQ family toxin [Lentilactobacillus hilgardii]MBZ2202284.1 type II toxin-antitoxin system mRNA interferase toxin, RelE/StbE family [Lentilactobacillus hilgardii]MBZ2205292.1 type II toxin-antitoxin system YafQ family toxin [Lentilactobacillus hilgardii]
MKKLRFKPRATFNADLKRLASLDKSIIDEVRAAIDMLLEQQQLPSEFDNHELNRRLAGYNEFHLRDTPEGKEPNEINDVLVVYRIDEDELVLIGIRIGSHERLFPGQNRSKSYRKNDK